MVWNGRGHQVINEAPDAPVRAALFVVGCPTRSIIRTGYGDLAGLIALIGVAAGIVIATLSMRWAARR